MSTELTADHRRRLELEEEIHEAGAIITSNITAIYDEELHLLTHKNWVSYFKDTFGGSASQAYRVVGDEKLIAKLTHSPIGEKIIEHTTESARRQVAGLPEEQQVEVLEAAVATAPRNDADEPVVTAKHVAETRDAVIVDPPNPVVSIVLDGAKRAVPDRLAKRHALAASINSAGTKFDQLRKLVLELEGMDGGEFISASEIRDGLSALKRTLTSWRYYTECPRCCGTVKADCKRCDGHGFIPYARKGQLSSEEQEWLQL